MDCCEIPANTKHYNNSKLPHQFDANYRITVPKTIAFPLAISLKLMAIAFHILYKPLTDTIAQRTTTKSSKIKFSAKLFLKHTHTLAYIVKKYVELVLKFFFIEKHNHQH